ncbi:MAG: cache domain-containing protein, partial [Chroococcidiopsidaceae cyanobacterium CP_BM_RX_35]|nr:cache domain-containing protein [Chroococcidiopsidaceae cyanobacterium CP_BM_RX_35]
MAKPGQSSFRRILLSRILLLSVPVLLIGEAVIFKKARVSLLETTSHNLIESAVRKGKSINDEIVALKANIFVASQTTVLQTGKLEAAQQFIDQLATQLPTRIQCIQLTNPQTNAIVASTCGNNGTVKAAPDRQHFSKQQSGKLGDHVYVEALLPKESLLQAQSPHSPSQLPLRLSAPVYNRLGQLRYVLGIQANLQEQELEVLGAGTIRTVVVVQNGPILTNPLIDRSKPKSEQE